MVVVSWIDPRVCCVVKLCRCVVWCGVGTGMYRCVLIGFPCVYERERMIMFYFSYIYYLFALF